MMQPTSAERSCRSLVVGRCCSNYEKRVKLYRNYTEARSGVRVDARGRVLVALGAGR